MTISIRRLFKGYYKPCECGCKELIKCIKKRGRFRKFKKGHNLIGKNNIRFNNNKSTQGEYNKIYKPYFKYSHKGGYVQEHRYIMHIYLSIKYNRIIYLPTKYDVHHRNGNKKDNRIENLQLLAERNHMIEHNLFNGDSNKKDMSGRFCNLCKITIDEYIFRDKWCKDINGYLCHGCYNTIRHFRKKFGLT